MYGVVTSRILLSLSSFILLSVHNDFFLSLSLSYRRVCFRAEMNRTRGSSRGGWGGEKRKRRRWKATREILGTIFGANGYKRGDWPRPIHHRVPPQLFPLRSPVFLLHSFAPPFFFLPFFPVERGKKGRVARNKTHPSRSACTVCCR